MPDSMMGIRSIAGTSRIGTQSYLPKEVYDELAHYIRK
jgi:hypothetical protein